MALCRPVIVFRHGASHLLQPFVADVRQVPAPACLTEFAELLRHPFGGVIVLQFGDAVSEIFHHVNNSAIFHDADANTVIGAVQHVGAVQRRAHEGFVRALNSDIVDDVFSRLIEANLCSQPAGKIGFSRKLMR